MTELEVVKWVVFGLMGVAVWFMKRTLDKTENKLADLDKDISIIRSEYLHKNDFKEFKMELRGMFEEIKKDIRTINHNNV